MFWVVTFTVRALCCWACHFCAILKEHFFLVELSVPDSFLTHLVPRNSSSKIVNNSPQVNEKGVLERMHITLQCWVVLERVSVLNHFPHTVCAFMLVRAGNPLSHRYVVAKGVSVLTV